MIAKNRYKKAFTLIELAIVLVIISLILAAVLVGKSVVKEGEIRSHISAFNGYQSAVRTFKLQFDAYPGDMTNATTFWPSAGNGNGDNSIDTASEFLNAWLELSLNGNVAGTFNGTASGLAPILGTNVPASKVNAAVGFSFDCCATYSINHTVVVVLASTNSACCNGLNGNGVNSDYAYTIDKKMDDGVASSGSIITMRAVAYDGTAGACVDQSGSYSGGIVHYILTDTAVDCRIWNIIN